jgi:hypothetical protein
MEKNKMKRMLSMMTRLTFATSLGLIAACGGSNTDAADNTPVEPSRETRIKDLATDACDRYEACTGYGTGTNQPYTSEAECEADFTTKAGKLWPEDKCGSGRINNGRYEVCTNSAKNVACGGGILDTIAALTDCNADQVCTDPPM